MFWRPLLRLTKRRKVFETSTCFFWFYCLTLWTNGPWSKRKIWQFWMKMKRSKMSKSEEAMLTKLDAHEYLLNLYLHEFFEPILFFDPIDYNISLSKREIWMKSKNWQNLHNRAGHAHQTRCTCIPYHPILALIFWVNSYIIQNYVSVYYTLLVCINCYERGSEWEEVPAGWWL